MSLNLFPHQTKPDESKAVTGIALVLTVGVALMAILYRWYQPITHQALLQFDIFDWARQSKEWLVYGHWLTPTSLWVFPIWNAMVAKLTGVDLFYVYLYSGALLTSFNMIIIYGISSILWKKHLIRLIPLIFYAFNTQLLARSVNYLPETMSYTFGLILVYFYLRLIFDRRPWWLIPIGIVNYFYFYLHQSGINFLIFTAGVVALYLLFLVPVSRLKRGILFAAFVLAGLAVAFTNSGIKQQIQYFLKGSKNVDIAFQGQAIPYEQIFSEYSVVFYAMLIFGVISIVWGFFKKRDIRLKIGWASILAIVLFYYSFLYLLPNLKLYSLVPWRFYTWFSLYAIFIVGAGVAAVQEMIHGRRILQSLVIGFFIVANIAHGTLISDNMYTADAATLHAMEALHIDQGSVVLVTNGNFLQARYALTGQDLMIQLAGPEVFKAADVVAAHTAANLGQTGHTVYLLISLYQLEQRPSQIDFWRNTAIYDTQLQLFNDSQYFEVVHQDAQVLLVRSRTVK